MPEWARWLAVFLGAGAGGVARYGVGRLLSRMSPGDDSGFVATVVVNVTGCLAIGVLAGWLGGVGGGGRSHQNVDVALRLLLITGFLGGYTTFSTFTREAVELYGSGRLAAAGTYVVTSVVVGILASAGGLALGSLIARGN